ncbi:hypothetical protein TNCV_1982241 [Trichonephila clavipes]|nr:hypothetical protein TNCV_1982241 [Trichonephila clavipes]
MKFNTGKKVRHHRDQSTRLMLLYSKSVMQQPIRARAYCAHRRGTEVHEQMSRSGGQFEARLPVFKYPRKHDTHLSTHCTKMKGSVNLTHPREYNPEFWCESAKNYHSTTGRSNVITQLSYQILDPFGRNSDEASFPAVRVTLRRRNPRLPILKVRCGGQVFKFNYTHITQLH